MQNGLERIRLIINQRPMLLLFLHFHHQLHHTYPYLHASAGKIEQQIPEIQVDYPAEVVPPEARRVIHEHIGDWDGQEADYQPPESAVNDHPFSNNTATVVSWWPWGYDRLDVVPQRLADRLEDQRRNPPNQQIKEDVPL